MKCLVYLGEHDTAWAYPYFKKLHPAMLNILNRPYIDHLLDFLWGNGCQEVRLILAKPSPMLETRLFDSHSHKLKLSFGLAQPEDDLDHIFLKNWSFCKDTKLLVIKGFPYLAGTFESLLESNKEWVITEGKTRIYFINSPNTTAVNFNRIETVFVPESLIVYSIDSLKNYYDLCMTRLSLLLNVESKKGVLKGIQVNIPKNSRLVAPTLLGNHLYLHKMTLIGPNVVIGRHVRIDSGTSIKNSIVFNDTYIGQDLEVKNKIVFRDRLIDPISGDIVHLVDSRLIARLEVEKKHIIRRRLFHIFWGVVWGIVWLIPMLLIHSVYIFSKKQNPKESFYVDHNRTRMLFPKSLVEPDSGIEKIYYRLSGDKYRLLPAVLKGHIALVGHQMLNINPENSRYLDELPFYIPGIFSLPEANGVFGQKEQAVVDELYYSRHFSAGLDMKILVKQLLRRLFVPWSNVEED